MQFFLIENTVTKVFIFKKRAAKVLIARNWFELKITGFSNSQLK